MRVRTGGPEVAAARIGAVVAGHPVVTHVARGGGGLWQGPTGHRRKRGGFAAGPRHMLSRGKNTPLNGAFRKTFLQFEKKGKKKNVPQYF